MIRARANAPDLALIVGIVVVPVREMDADALFPQPLENRREDVILQFGIHCGGSRPAETGVGGGIAAGRTFAKPTKPIRVATATPVANTGSGSGSGSVPVPVPVAIGETRTRRSGAGGKQRIETRTIR
jgi:hypothetical protein